MEYISENHSKHLLMCHLIFVCKYRKKLLTKLGNDIKVEVENIANHYGWQIIEQEIQLLGYGKNIVIIFLSIFGKSVHFGVMDILLVALEMLARKPSKSTFKHKVVKAYIP